MSSTKVINLGNNCSPFSQPINSQVSLPPGNGGRFYVNSGGNFLYYSPTTQATVMSVPIDSTTKVRIPETFTYFGLTFGLAWNPAVPGSGLTAPAGQAPYTTTGDSRLRILYPHYLSATDFTKSIIDFTKQVIVDVSAGTNYDSFRVVKNGTSTPFTGFSAVRVGDVFNYSGSTSPPFTFSDSKTSVKLVSYYLLNKSWTKQDQTKPKNIIVIENGSLVSYDINNINSIGKVASLIDIYYVVRNQFDVYDTSRPIIAPYLELRDNTSGALIQPDPPPSKLSLGMDINIYDFTDMGTSTVAPGLELVNNNITFAGTTDIPLADPDPELDLTSTNGIIFQYVSPALTTTITNPVLGFLPGTDITGDFEMTIDSFYNFYNTDSISAPFFMIYDVNQEVSSPNLNNTQFVLFTPDFNYALTISTNKTDDNAVFSLTSTATFITTWVTGFEAFGGYWSTIASGSSFYLRYTTNDKKTYDVGSHDNTTIALYGPGANTDSYRKVLFNCMMCSPTSRTMMATCSSSVASVGTVATAHVFTSLASQTPASDTEIYFYKGSASDSNALYRFGPFTLPRWNSFKTKVTAGTYLKIAGSYMYVTSINSANYIAGYFVNFKTLAKLTTSGGFTENKPIKSTTTFSIGTIV